MTRIAAAIAAAVISSAAHAVSRTLSMDDVLGQSRIDRVTRSPDGEWIAVVVQRPAMPGEAYGRTYYELDPSRGDIWLISRRTGERRNLTGGAENAAGFWCATWSPDGSKLAMLSTRPEGDEPRGGDNVRLYVWDQATDRLERLNEFGIMTQSMGGSPMYRLDIRGGSDGSSIAHRCSDEENAPFIWIDKARILTVSLPKGAVSGLIDAASRPMKHAGDTLRKLQEGIEPTMTAANSGTEHDERPPRTESAFLQTIDVETKSAAVLGTVPVYPFRGELTISLAPDLRRVAILATVGAIPPMPDMPPPLADDSWSVQKQLGFGELAPRPSIRWVAMPDAASLPLDLYDWSPDARRIALRARPTPASRTTPLFIASVTDGAISRSGSEQMSVGGMSAGAAYPLEKPALWLNDRQMLVRATADFPAASQSHASRPDWWLLSGASQASNLTMQSPEVPEAFRTPREGEFLSVASGRLMRLDLSRRRLERLSTATAPGGAIIWPRDPAGKTSEMLIATTEPNGDKVVERISLDGLRRNSEKLNVPRSARLVDYDPSTGQSWWHEQTQAGLFLRERSWGAEKPRDVLSLNTQLGEIDWGQKRLIDYRTADGQVLKAAVILPPGYQADRRYPTIAWVYSDYVVTDINDYFLDPFLPGIYNLYLYAARGYVVMIPSLPRKSGPQAPDLLRDNSQGTLAAVDRLIAMGITDPDRVGVMGQSFGGYSVYALITQTNRFKAAAALAGITDLTAFYNQFDPTARGYPAIEHEKSWNWAITESGSVSLGRPPYRDYPLYWKNSPLAFVDHVQTPLLMVHGEHDSRGPMSQAESFFFSLYRQGKTARLLRYWGENHGLSQSPANVRSIFKEVNAWFDKYLSVGNSSHNTDDRLRH